MRAMRSAIVAISMLGMIASARADGVDLRVDVEPAAYALRGYSLHLASTMPFAPRLNLGGTLYGFDVPGMLIEMGDNRATDWDVRLRVGYGVFWDYYFDAPRDGWLVGGQVGFQQYRATGLGTDAIFTDIMLLVRAGYEWHPRGGGGYLMPWVGAAMTGTVSGSAGAYDVFPVLPYAACDLGWRF